MVGKLHDVRLAQLALATTAPSDGWPQYGQDGETAGNWPAMTGVNAEIFWPSQNFIP